MEIEGVIIDVDDVVQELKGLRDNPSVRAVVMRINSPGGVVGPTQEVHDAILRLRQAGKPVVASLGAVAASGGYYIAVAADQIYANPGTLTGSIGVIMQMANFEQLMKKVGVDYVVVKAGQFKDHRQPRPPDEPRTSGACCRRCSTTCTASSSGRWPPAASSSARTWCASPTAACSPAQQAKDLKMVDALGGLEDAVLAAGKLAGLPSPPAVIPPKRKFSFMDLLRNQFGGSAAAALLRPSLPAFKTPLYLMD